MKSEKALARAGLPSGAIPASVRAPHGGLERDAAGEPYGDGLEVHCDLKKESPASVVEVMHETGHTLGLRLAS